MQTTTEQQQPGQQPTPVVDTLSAEDRADITPGPPEPYAAPKDADESVATGYAVYDRTLGRYVTGVTVDKPGKPASAVAEGHSYKVVRV